MLRLAFDFIITWRETRTRPNAYQNIVSSLPDKCRFIFEQYLYSNLTPQEIADKNNISVNTVRVHVKNAMDKIREKVGSRVGILLFFLF